MAELLKLSKIQKDYYNKKVEKSLLVNLSLWDKIKENKEGQMIKKEKIELVKKAGIFAGIDIASRRHHVRFIDNLGEDIIKPISFSNDLEGIRKLEKHIFQIPNIYQHYFWIGAIR